MHDAGTWCNKWHEEHTEKNWETFKKDFLTRFVLKDTALMIICQVKNLTQTGTIKELTRAYKELCLCAPFNMVFDNPATHLMYYNALKLHVMRHVNLDQVTNLQSLYCEAKKAEQMSNALHKAQSGKRERPKDSHPSECSNRPPPGNGNSNANHKPSGSNGHGNGKMDNQTGPIYAWQPLKTTKTREKPGESTKQAKLSPEYPQLAQ